VITSSRPLLRSLATIAFAVTTAQASVALAHESAKVVVLPISAHGELTPHGREDLLNRLVIGLERGNFSVVRAVTLDPPMTTSCVDRPCRQTLARRTASSYLVQTNVNAHARRYEIHLEVVDGRSGEVIVQSRETCELCGLAEVGEILQHHGAALRARIDAFALDPPVLRIETRPRGAWIKLNGRAIGRSPLEHVTIPGEHELEATHPGYVSQKRRLRLVAGVTETVALWLQPMPRVNHDIHLERLGWAALAIGSLAVATGITLLVLDDRPIRTICSGNDVDADGDCRYRYDTKIAGAIVLVTGAALTATGTGLTIGLGRKHRRQTSSHLQTRILSHGPGLHVRF